MYFVKMRHQDIRDNLATEQYLMNHKHFEEPLLLFYIEKPCIIVGRNQNTFEEVNMKYVKEHDITVTRRLSGGGAVYQDLGNLCFSLVVDAQDKSFGDFKSFVQPIVDALHEMGATSVEVSGRNDILVDGKKFSGNAMYTKDGKIFSHGTLSYNVNLDDLVASLHVPEDKIKSKGIKSIRSRVTNIRPYLDKKFQSLTTEQFRDILIAHLFHVTSLDEVTDREYKLTPEDEQGIAAIKNELYDNWDWVYGKSPEFTVKKRQHFDYGTVDARLLVEEGRIKQVTFFGDFFGQKDASEIAQALAGIPYDAEHIHSVLNQFDLANYFTGISPDQLTHLLSD